VTGDGATPCAGKTHLFYAEHEPGLNARTRRAWITQAKQICSSCPLKAACYATAAARDEPDGIWGGVAFPDEHRALMRRARTTA